MVKRLLFTCCNQKRMESNASTSTLETTHPVQNCAKTARAVPYLSSVSVRVGTLSAVHAVPFSISYESKSDGQLSEIHAWCERMVPVLWTRTLVRETFRVICMLRTLSRRYSQTFSFNCLGVTVTRIGQRIFLILWIHLLKIKDSQYSRSSRIAALK